MISFVRVDNRLIHGQVVEVWLSNLKVNRILVADDAAAANPLLRAAMGIAVPPPLVVEVVAMGNVDFAKAQSSPDRILLLLSDVQDVMRARDLGLVFSALNLGNVHYLPGRVQITPSVFLSSSEVANLRELALQGVAIEACALPREKPVLLEEIEARLLAGTTGH